MVQSAKTTALMVACVLVCYLPLIIKWHLCGQGLNSPAYSIISQVLNSHMRYRGGKYPIVQALVAANSFMNPLIYAMKIPAFKKTLVGYVKKIEPEYSESGADRRTSVAGRVLTQAAVFTIDMVLKL